MHNDDPLLTVASSAMVPIGLAIFCYKRQVIGVLKLGDGRVPPDDVEYDEVFFNPVDYDEMSSALNKMEN